MAELLINSKITSCLEELIRDAKEYLILVSPYLQLSDRIKNLLTYKVRQKIKIRVIYGKEKLKSDEYNWLNQHGNYIQTIFCEHLHAKCYLNEESCIITSLNLYEYSQVNNYEMGIFIRRSEDTDLYKSTLKEVHFLIESRQELEILNKAIVIRMESAQQSRVSSNKVPFYKIAERLKIKKSEVNNKLVEAGYIVLKTGRGIQGHYELTAKGIEAGGEIQAGNNIILWPENLEI